MCPFCCSSGSSIHLLKTIESIKGRDQINRHSDINSNNNVDQNEENFSELTLIPRYYDYIGTIVRLYSVEEMCYHSGRIIGKRCIDNEITMTADSFKEFDKFEYLVQFKKFVSSNF